MLVIGLAGGIASGKSTACAQLSELGAATINADALGHEAYQQDTECYRKLVAAFGSGIVAEDGGVNRRALGAIVFADKARMRELEGIVWPEIEARLLSRLAALRDAGSTRVVVVEAAILLEAGWERHMDEVWVTCVPREVARDRLMKRNGLSEEAALQRIDAQMSNEERAARARVVIWNSGTEEELRDKVRGEFARVSGPA